MDSFVVSITKLSLFFCWCFTPSLKGCVVEAILKDFSSRHRVGGGGESYTLRPLPLNTNFSYHRKLELNASAPFSLLNWIFGDIYVVGNSKENKLHHESHQKSILVNLSNEWEDSAQISLWISIKLQEYHPCVVVVAKALFKESAFPGKMHAMRLVFTLCGKILPRNFAW